MYKSLLNLYLKYSTTEKAFRMAAKTLSLLRSIPFGRQMLRLHYKSRIKDNLRQEVFGLDFKNPVGLAASVDKDASYFDILSEFGFSFIEVGPMCIHSDTTQIKLHNETKLKRAVEHLRTERPECIISGNITRNEKSKGQTEVIRDYEEAFALLYDFVDMIVISPQYSSLDPEGQADISDIPDIIDRMLTLRMYYDVNKPILVRLTPSLTHSQTEELINCCLSSGIDGVVAGSTVSSISDPGGNELFVRNLEFVKYIKEKSDGLLPIIAVGGIMNGEGALKMLDAGAMLVEVFTGFFREGPSIVNEIVNYIAAKTKDRAKKAITEQYE